MNPEADYGEYLQSLLHQSRNNFNYPNFHNNYNLLQSDFSYDNLNSLAEYVNSQNGTATGSYSPHTHAPTSYESRSAGTFYDRFMANPFSNTIGINPYDDLDAIANYPSHSGGDAVKLSDIPITSKYIVESGSEFVDKMGDVDYRSKWINEDARQWLEIALSTVGGVAGGTATLPSILGVPTGAMVGGALGHSAGNAVADFLDMLFGKGEQQPNGLIEALYKTMGKTAEGLKYELLGGAAGAAGAAAIPLLRSIWKNRAKIIKNAPTNRPVNETITRPKPKAPFMNDDEIVDVMPRLLDGSAPFYKTGHMKDEWAKIIKEKTGVDLTGYNIAFTSSGVRHMFTKHGNNTLYPRDKGRSMGKKELFTTLIDMPRAAKLPNNFDDVFLLKDVGYNDARRLIFIKNLPDGFVMVTEMQTRYGNLVPVTAFKVAKKGMNEEEVLAAIKKYIDNNIK